MAGPGGAVLVVRVPVELSIATAESVRSCVERRLPNRHDGGVVLDLADTELITSVGVTALLQIEELAAAAGVSLRLAGLGGAARRVLVMLALADRFMQSPDAEDAVASIANAR